MAALACVLLAAGCGSSGGADTAASGAAETVAEESACPEGTSAGSSGDICLADGDPRATEALTALREAAGKTTTNAVLAGVWVDGEPILQTAQGSAFPGVPATRDAHFKTGNVTQSMTSTILLQLVDEGKAELDDPVSKWFPELPRSEEVTLKMLANSTSGYADYAQTLSVLKAFLTDPFQEYRPAELVELGTSQKPLFAPGTSWSFSDTNYVLLGEILTEITGQPVAELVEERIAEPLGLDNTALQSVAGVPEPAIHGYTNARGVFEDSTYWTPTLFPGNGNGTSTLSDIGRWAEALGTGELVSEEAHKQQIAPDTAGLGVLTDDFYKGFGLIVSNSWIFAGTPNIEGYQGVVAYLPSERITLVIFNTEGLGADPTVSSSAQIVNPVAEVLAPDTPPQLTPPRRKEG